MLCLFALMGLLAPELALAETVNPASGNTWTIYVFGNGYVVEEILRGVTMLMTGNDVFSTLLLFLATVGFLALAIGAGFDPGKNLLKMFTYIIVVWFVSYASTRLTANVEVLDLVRTNQSIIEVSPNPPVQTGVPALVVLPAAVTSQIGVRFTQFIETYFSTVVGPAFTVGGGGGQFNLFNRMIQESDQYVINSPELKRTLSAYVANCVVPAIALGRLNGPVGNSGGAVAGVDALVKSTDFLEVLRSASSPSIFTQYFPVPGPDGKYSVNWGTVAPDMAGLSEDDLKKQVGMGALTTCDVAYTQIETDMNNFAEAMVGAGAQAWAKSGILVPFEEAYSVMLSKASAAGGAGANFSRPSGFIMQQAMLNSMSGTFRQAAAQTGNNELMQAAALSQAEQQQKSAWVAGFSVFNNMMGYVFTVLQVVHLRYRLPSSSWLLLIPGLGKTIFVNYAQILIWLTLWQPMLAIINFIITLFGSEAFAQSIGAGVSASNKAIISERANDLVIAAQFLGTMVPLLTWGIVKGAMAFTEFISSGVGSAFASQAGAAAATGNMSLNNMSMDNTSMNKFNTMSSSAVGSQAVQASMGTGAMEVSQVAGGTSASANAQVVQNAKQLAAQAQTAESRTRAVSDAASAMKTETHSMAQLVSQAGSRSSSSSQKQAAMEALSNVISATTGLGAGDSLAFAKAIVNADQASGGRNVSNEYGIEGSISAGRGKNPVGLLMKAAGVDVKAHTGANNSSTNSHNKSTGATDAMTSSIALELGKHGISKAGSKQLADSFARESSQSADSSTRGDKSESTQVQEALSKVKSTNDGYANSLSAMRSTLESQSFSGATGLQDLNRMREEFEHLKSQMPTMAGLAQDRGAMELDYVLTRDQYQQTVDNRGAALGTQVNALRGGSGQFAPAAHGTGAGAAGASALFDENKRAIIHSSAQAYFRAQGLDGDAAKLRADTAVGPGYLNAAAVEDLGSGKAGLTQFFDRVGVAHGDAPSPSPAVANSPAMTQAKAQLTAAENQLRGLSMAPQMGASAKAAPAAKPSATPSVNAAPAARPSAKAAPAPSRK